MWIQFKKLQSSTLILRYFRTSIYMYMMMWYCEYSIEVCSHVLYCSVIRWTTSWGKNCFILQRKKILFHSYMTYLDLNLDYRWFIGDSGKYFYAVIRSLLQYHKCTKGTYRAYKSRTIIVSCFPFHTVA